MTYSSDTVEALAFVSAPYQFADICLIYPLNLGTILGMQGKYERYVQLLTLDRSFMIRKLQEKNIEIDHSKIPDPFDYIIAGAALDDKLLLDLQAAFYTFIKEKITILFDQKMIVVGSPKEKRVIDKENFSDFQNILRIQNKIQEIAPIPENESPMAKKFREKRELRDAVKRKQASKDSAHLVELMGALCVYQRIPPEAIKNISIYAFRLMLQLSQEKERYDIEMSYLSNGADSKKLKPKHWIKNF